MREKAAYKYYQRLDNEYYGGYRLPAVIMLEMIRIARLWDIIVCGAVAEVADN